MQQTYTIERVLGSGGQGVALLCRDTLKKRNVVVKVYKSQDYPAFSEIFGLGIMHRLGSPPNISGIIDVFLHNGRLATVSELQGMKLYLQGESGDVAGNSLSIESVRSTVVPV